MAREDTAAAAKNELQPELMSIMKEEVGKARERRVPIIRAFEEIARRSGLKANTIRNYYYRYLYANEEMIKADAKTTREESGQEDDIGRPFTDSETRDLMREMLIGQGRGESVRACANRLGNGSKRMLIRYQNKYRSIIAREPKYVESIIRDLTEEGITSFNPYTRRKLSKTGKDPVSISLQGSEGQLVDWVSQFFSNIHNTQVVSLQSLVKGLLDLSSLAVGNQGLAHRMEKYNQEIQELNSRIFDLEKSLDKEREEIQPLRYRLYELEELNKGYMELSDEEKLSGLHDYLSSLQSCIQ
ncbi:MAG TPA: hypothetical protein DIW17_19050 [Clostridiales bacterium]|nr:hypothetical protein [Clostridiales bacterium]